MSIINVIKNRSPSSCLRDEQQSIDNDQLSSSPTDLSYDQQGQQQQQFSLKKSNSFPIQSNLPNMFNNLRTNEESSSIPPKHQQQQSSSKSFIKKLLHINNKDDIPLTTNGPPSTKSLLLLLTRKLQRGAPFMFHSLSEEITNDQTRLHPQLSKLIGHIKIPSIFIKGGMSLLKVSHKSRKRILFYIDPSSFKFTWKVSTNLSPMVPSNPTTVAAVPGIVLPAATPTITTTGGGRLSISNGSSRTYEFTLDDIKSIYMTKDASSYREELNISKEFESKWITIIYYNLKKKKLKTIHLITDLIHDFKKFSSVLNNLKLLRDVLSKEFLINLNDLDENQRLALLDGNEGSGDGYDVGDDDEDEGKQVREFLSFDDILKYAKRLNININRNRLQSIFDHVCRNVITAPNSNIFEKGLNFEQFKLFISYLKRRDDIQQIWSNLIGPNNEFMTFETFKHFILNIQQETLDPDYILKIFNKFSHDNHHLSIEGFNNYLLSKYCQPLKSLETSTDTYFSHPMNEYYISSSHNTYLIGRQVVGDSSVDGYIRALQRGCRCLEIDIWDGPSSSTSDEDSENNSEPVVNHGRTFTTLIRFDNVIRTIKKFAFVLTPFPVILSLEIHCSIGNQIKVVNILREILGLDMITSPVDDSNTLPSPLMLRYKFLIKVKKTSPFEKLIEMENGSFTSATTTATTTTTTSFSEDNASTSTSIPFMRKTNKVTKISNELSDLGIYVQGIKFRNFSLPESKTYNHVFSISEKSMNNMIKTPEKQVAIDKHNRKYFMRIYPSKIRLKSSNFIPVNYWKCGVQMVATNWQTYDLGQQLNEALFDGVDRKGFVLKPDSLRKPLIRTTTSRSKKQVVKTSPMMVEFEIEIISAHQLPKKDNNDTNESGGIINPYVCLEFIGGNSIEWTGESGGGKMKGKTNVVKENGFNPIWNHKFLGKVHVGDDYDLLFVKFMICNDNGAQGGSGNGGNNGGTDGGSGGGEEGSPIGLLVSKLSYLNQGYRYLPINDLFGEQLVYSSLFVKINYKYYHHSA